MAQRENPPDIPRLRDFIEQIVDRYDSVEEIQAEAESLGHPQPLESLLTFQNEDVPRLRVTSYILFWDRMLGQIHDYMKWNTLGNSPKQFNAAMEAMLDGIRKFMRVFYNVPANRPREHSERDAKVYALKKSNPHWSYGQIARTAGIEGESPSKVAREAFERERKRRKKALRRLLETLADGQDSGTFLGIGQPLNDT